MLDGTNAGRARLFENLRNDHIAEKHSEEIEEVIRIQPLTAQQADGICKAAMQSLMPRF